MNTVERNGQVSLRLSVTDRCHLRCRYCVPAQGITKRPPEEILSYEEILCFVRVINRHYKISKIHVTGGDPLARAGIADFIGMLKGESVADLALTTNGQRLARLAPPLKEAGLSRINISLDTLNPATFRDLTRGGDLFRTLDGIQAAVGEGFSPIKLNMVVLRNVNDREIIDIGRFGISLGCHVRFLELMPTRSAVGDFSRLFISTAEVKERLKTEFEMEPLLTQKGASSRNMLARDRDGRTGVFGFISPYSAPFCDGCARLRLTATGQLIGCLARGVGPHIRHLLHDHLDPDESRLVETISAALTLKRSTRSFSPAREENPWSPAHAAMSAIGG